MSNATKTAKRSDFKKYFQFMWRSLNIQASWNYERQMNMGFLYGIAPTLDELYPDENDPEQLAHKRKPTSVRWRSTTAPPDQCLYAGSGCFHGGAVRRRP